MSRLCIRSRCCDRGEGGGEAAVDLLARRVGGDQRRVRRLDRLELAHQLVVLAVADQRLVADVVGEGVPVELLGEVAVPGARVVGDLGEVLPVGRGGDLRLVEFLPRSSVGIVLTRCTVSGRVRRSTGPFPRTGRYSGCRYFAASRTWAIAARA